ncbi:MAG: hypothetical protein WA951_05205 [Leeuwenhoekiella sp.]
MILNKKRLLVKGLIFDLVGMATMAIPVVGPFLDLGWAPYAANQMSKMYPGKKGKLASILVFIEEILPFTDIVPSFTLMWLYTFVLSNKPTAAGEKIYNAEVIS